MPTSSGNTQTDTPEKRLYVTDLDGTLLRSDETVSPYTAETLNTAIVQGLPLTYRTSRSYAAAGPLTAAVAFRLPAIVSSGAFVVDPRTGVPLHANVLARDLVAAILTESAARGWSPFVFGSTAGREIVAYRERLGTGQQGWVARRRRHGDRRLHPVAAPVPLEITYELMFLSDERASRTIAASLQRTYGAWAA